MSLSKMTNASSEIFFFSFLFSASKEKCVIVGGIYLLGQKGDKLGCYVVMRLVQQKKQEFRN